MLIEADDWVICVAGVRVFVSLGSGQWLRDLQILYWGETVTSYFGTLSPSRDHSSRTVELKIAVIKYNYVGYHIWDVPSDWDSTPGAKFSYAVGVSVPIEGHMESGLTKYRQSCSTTPSSPSSRPLSCSFFSA